jgi:hypothetical protein
MRMTRSFIRNKQQQQQQHPVETLRDDEAPVHLLKEPSLVHFARRRADGFSRLPNNKCTNNNARPSGNIGKAGLETNRLWPNQPFDDQRLTQFRQMLHVGESAAI